MSRETDLAWCAGFFDGEGCVKYNRTRPDYKTANVSRLLQCSISQKSENVEVLEFFQSVVGLGEVKGPYPIATGTKHIVSFRKHEVKSLFEILKPYLRAVKTRDFQVALEKFANHDSNMTSEDYGK